MSVYIYAYIVCVENERMKERETDSLAPWKNYNQVVTSIIGVVGFCVLIFLFMP